MTVLVVEISTLSLYCPGWLHPHKIRYCSTLSGGGINEIAADPAKAKLAHELVKASAIEASQLRGLSDRAGLEQNLLDVSSLGCTNKLAIRHYATA